MKNCDGTSRGGLGYGGRAFGYFYHSGLKLDGDPLGSGLCTEAVKILEYRYKSFYWHSADSSGVFTVQVSEPDDTWHDYDERAFASGVLETFIMTGQGMKARLCNEANASGTITAWYVMRT